MSGSPLLLVPLYLSHLTPLFPPSSTIWNGIFLYLNGIFFCLYLNWGFIFFACIPTLCAKWCVIHEGRCPSTLTVHRHSRVSC